MNGCIWILLIIMLSLWPARYRHSDGIRCPCHPSVLSAFSGPHNIQIHPPPPSTPSTLQAVLTGDDRDVPAAAACARLGPRGAPVFPRHEAPRCAPVRGRAAACAGGHRLSGQHAAQVHQEGRALAVLTAQWFLQCLSFGCWLSSAMHSMTCAWPRMLPVSSCWPSFVCIWMGMCV